jgi:hypothetical protein
MKSLCSGSQDARKLRNQCLKTLLSTNIEVAVSYVQKLGANSLLHWELEI